NLHLEFCVSSDANQVHMQQAAGNGVHLPIADHDSRRRLSLDLQGEERVVARFGPENPQNLAGVHVHRKGGSASPINHRGNATAASQTPVGILSEIHPWLCLHCLCLVHTELLLNPVFEAHAWTSST